MVDTSFIYVVVSTGWGPDQYTKRKLTRETPTQYIIDYINGGSYRFDKKTGCRIGSDSYHPERLCTAEEYVRGKKAEYEYVIQKTEREIEELQKTIDGLKARIATARTKQDSVGV